MMTSFSITNFKAFSTQQRVPLKPITLVYGQNSSGKSSLHQSLLLLKQTLESSENPDTLLIPKGNLVDLGGFREFINGHDVKKPFSFEIRMALPKEPRSLPGILLNPLENSDAKTFGIRVEMAYDEATSAAILSSLNFFLGEHTEELFSFKAERQQVKQRYARRFGFSASAPRAGVAECVLRLSKLNHQHPFWISLWSTVKPYINREVLKHLSKQLEVLNQQLNKLRGPEFAGLEEAPKIAGVKRIEKQLQECQELLTKLDGYSQSEFICDVEKQIVKAVLLCRNFLPVGMTRHEKEEQTGILAILEEVGGFGYDLTSLTGLVIFSANALQNSLESTIYIGPLRDYPERHYIFSGNHSDQVGKSGKMVPDVLFKRRDLLERVNQQMELFGLDYELKVSSVNDRDSDLQDVFALRLFDKRSQIHASILDVGFGISQILPIIVQSMLSTGKTLIIEQPEIHLHPKLQADLGTLVATCSKEPFGNQFIIETHSQHLILRLQKLIRQGKLTPEDVAVIYVDRCDNGSQCIELRLDKDGDFIDNWPNGFFEEGYRELFS